MSGVGRVRLCGYVKRSTLNSAGYLEVPDWTVGVRTCAVRNKPRLAWVLTSQIRPFKRSGLNFKKNDQGRNHHVDKVGYLFFLCGAPSFVFFV